MRIVIRVRPGASSTSVGGDHDGALVVRVREPAEKGRATTAALRAVAEALGVPERGVRLVSGSTSRKKVVELDLGLAASDTGRRHAEQAAMRRLRELRHAGAPPTHSTHPPVTTRP